MKREGVREEGKEGKVVEEGREGGRGGEGREGEGKVKVKEALIEGTWREERRGNER